MLCSFLLYNNVNRLYVYIYTFPLEPPSQPRDVVYLLNNCHTMWYN